MPETKENISEYDLIAPAKKLLDAVAESAEANKVLPMTEERQKNLKLTLGFLNAYLRAFHAKVGYYKLTGVKEKLDALEGRG